MLPLQSNDPQINALLSAIRTLLVTLGTGLVSAGVLTKESPVYFWIMTASGLVLVVGPAAWGVWVAVQHVMAVKAAATAGVNAGINLVVAGHALNTDGTTIAASPASKPLPASNESAQSIIHDFGNGSG